MTNDDKNFQELKELLINKASDMGFTYSTYGLESLAEAILDAGYSRPTPQQPSEPLKELAKYCYEIFSYPDPVKWEDLSEIGRDSWTTRTELVMSKFGQPSEKKALSVEDMKKIMWDLENKLGYQPAYETIAQAIHSALPAQREVNFKDLVTELELLKSYFEDTWEVVLHKNDIKWKVIDQAIDEFKKLNS